MRWSGSKPRGPDGLQIVPSPRVAAFFPPTPDCSRQSMLSGISRFPNRGTPPRPHHSGNCQTFGVLQQSWRIYGVLNFHPPFSTVLVKTHLVFCIRQDSLFR